MGRYYNPKTVTDGLVLCLDASNPKSYPGTGTAWNDISGNGNNGTLFNSPTYDGEGISFNGSTQYMVATMGTTELDGDPNFTVELIIKKIATINSATGFWGIGGSGTGNSVEGWTPAANMIHLDHYASSRFATSPALYYPDNIFSSIIWTKNGIGSDMTTVKCYVNGVEVSIIKTMAGSANHFNTSTTGFSLGRINANASTMYAPIKVGVFKVYNRGLTADEVKQNFNALRGRFGL